MASIVIIALVKFEACVLSKYCNHLSFGVVIPKTIGHNVIMEASLSNQV